MSEETTAMGESSSAHVPVTYEHCAHIKGPFFHGTKSALVAGDELVPGYGSNFQDGRVSNHIYFTALVDTAAWGAELATALAGSDKRFPGNVTQSYRTRHPLRVVGEVDDWVGHDPEVLKGMLDHLAQLREQGLDVIED
jgi:hypothetical protein